MIEKLQIRNFRTHKKLDITFSPLVNSIIGRNAVGKSTIIRAIRWVVRNKPAGDSVINWDANKAAVRLTIDENKITRTRGRGINTYRLNKEKPYKAFKKGVPKKIERVINLSDINFQGQHEAPFWFCKSAGEVSRQLNAIINLEIIDNTLSNIDSALRKSRTVIEITKGQLDKVLSQRDSLVYIRKVNEDLEAIETLQKQHREKAVGCSLLRDILKSAYSYVSKRDNARELTRDSKIALYKGSKHHKITVRVEELSELVKSGETLQGIVRARPLSLNHLEKLKKNGEEIVNQNLLLGELISKLKYYKEIKCQTEKDSKKYKTELEKIAGGRCLLCGQALKK